MRNNFNHYPITIEQHLHNTGIWTGSLATDKLLVHMGFRGEGLGDSRVLLVKSHLMYTPSFRNPASLKAVYGFDRVITLVRNPFHGE